MGERITGSFEQLVNHKSGGSGKFFSLKNGEEARVRFLFNKTDEIHMYNVHEFTNPYVTIACARHDGESEDSCKYCAQKNLRLARVVFPLYNIDTNEILYWKRTVSFAKDKVVPLLQEIESINQPLSAQVYKIKRSGDGRDTTYSVVPTGQPDGKTKEEFGVVEDPYDLGIIKETDYEYVPAQNNSGNGGNNFSQNNYNNQSYGGFGNNPPQATRRTAAFD